MKPEWVIYKNEQKIGQAVTWHKALDILVKQEGLVGFECAVNASFVSVLLRQEGLIYKIIKEN